MKLVVLLALFLSVALPSHAKHTEPRGIRFRQNLDGVLSPALRGQSAIIVKEKSILETGTSDSWTETR
jgi:hypothetical protein